VFRRERERENYRSNGESLDCEITICDESIDFGKKINDHKKQKSLNEIEVNEEQWIDVCLSFSFGLVCLVRSSK
jgi:hypothetical protein